MCSLSKTAAGLLEWSGFHDACRLFLSAFFLSRRGIERIGFGRSIEAIVAARFAEVEAFSGLRTAAIEGIEAGNISLEEAAYVEIMVVIGIMAKITAEIMAKRAAKPMAILIAKVRSKLFANFTHFNPLFSLAHYSIEQLEVVAINMHQFTIVVLAIDNIATMVAERNIVTMEEVRNIAIANMEQTTGAKGLVEGILNPISGQIGLAFHSCQSRRANYQR